jgi:D-lactate dehydrogenase
MQIAVFSTKPYDKQFLAPAAGAAGHQVRFFEARLMAESCPLADGSPVVCAFVNDELHSVVLECLYQRGTRMIALRCAGFNNVDLAAAAALGMQVARVPAYSPYAVAEHTIGLILALNRKLHRAYNRVRDGNFSIDGLLGFDLHGKTAGVIGTGKIGALVATTLKCFGCEVLLHDLYENDEGRSIGRYVTREELLARADVISLHCPLAPGTHHLIDDAAVARMKPGVMIINTSRGALVDTHALVRGLKSGRIGYVGLDVYEEEADLFFEDLSNRVIQDDTFTRLLTFPNVLITSHQAFFTRNALEEIARVTMSNVTQFEKGEPLTNAVTVQKVKK